MAIVVDAARNAYTEWGNYKSPPYTKGNDNPNTPNPSYQNGWAWTLLSAPETHIVQKAQNTPTNNTTDAWVPMSIEVHTLDSVDATWRG